MYGVKSSIIKLQIYSDCFPNIDVYIQCFLKAVNIHTITKTNSEIDITVSVHTCSELSRFCLHTPIGRVADLTHVAAVIITWLNFLNLQNAGIFLLNYLDSTFAD